MSDLNNIEDIFKGAFEDHKVTPDSSSWDVISRRLWLNQVGSFFKTAFNEFRIEPKSKTWDNISRRLWFARFMKFNPNTINIYYSAAAAILIVAALYYVPGKVDKKNNPEVNSVQTAMNIVTERNSDPVSKEEKRDSIKEKTGHKEIINFLNTSPDKEKVKNKNIKHNEAKNKKNVKQEFSAYMTNDLINKKKDNNQKIAANNLTALNTAENINIENSNLNNVNHSTEYFSNKVSYDKINGRFPILGITAGPEVIPDTLGYNVAGFPIIVNKSSWSADVWYSPLLSEGIYYAKSSEYKSYAEGLKDLSATAVSGNIGLSLNYHYKNLVFQGGIAYTRINGRQSVPETKNSIYTRNHTNYYDRWEYINDTVYFIDLDALLQGDTIYIPYITQVLTQIQDSNIVISNDTIWTKTFSDQRNNFSSIEIPILAGYAFNSNKLSVEMKGGISTSIFINSKGKTVALDNNNSADLNSELKFATFNFSVLLNLGIYYRISEKFSIFGEPYLRRNITSVFRNDAKINAKYQSTGIKLGIRYKF